MRVKIIESSYPFALHISQASHSHMPYLASPPPMDFSFLYHHTFGDVAKKSIVVTFSTLVRLTHFLLRA
jgi:hypothetical protein